MESNQQRRAAGLKDKMPDIQKTLDMVQFLKTRKVCGLLEFWGFGILEANWPVIARFRSNRSYIRA